MRDIHPGATTFYDAPNEIDVDSLQDEDVELIRVLWSRPADGQRTLLPAKFNNTTRWYGIAESDREGRLLMEEMVSWLGPPLCDHPHVIEEPGDLLDERAKLLTNDGVLLRTCVTDGWQREARQNVRSLVNVWMITPERASDAPRPVGRVLRHFYEAIAARDRNTATEALQEIEAGGMLSAKNRRFLRVELLGSLGTPKELQEDPLLQDISLFRRPPTVTDILAQAADGLYIPPDADNSGSVAWRRIALNIEEAWPGLIVHPSQIRSVSGARCLALAELFAEHPRRGVIDCLRTDWVEDALVAGIAALLESSSERPLKGISTVLGYHHSGEFERVLDAAEQVKPEPGVASAVMHAALNLGDAIAAARAVALVDRLPDLDRRSLLSQAAEGVWYAQLVERNEGAQVPDGWVEWLQGDWPDRPDLLNDWCSSWEREAFAVAGEPDVLALELIDALNDQRRGRIRNGLSVFIRWLVADGGLRPSSVPLAVTVLDIMLNSEPGRAERRVALDLLDEILLTGCTTAEYQTAVTALSDQLVRLGAREVDWLTGILDVQLLSGVPDTRMRGRFFAKALAVAVSWIGRIEEADAIVLSKLFKELGLVFTPALADLPESQSSPRLRAFKRVGIYSLSESAAKNAARWIRDEWPDVDVRLSHAHSGSSELNSFVRGSDVVLMQTSHAKHAATIVIERAIETSRLVRVNGRGATSLFRCLLKWATEAG
ncbi:MAG: hypothetical protein F4059_09215 [Gemmatimonadetes bacterium]|nr:hypothetical protein [Gemmatimonadota bacterium]